MIVLSGAELVLPDRILAGGTLVIDGSRIADIRTGTVSAGGPHSAFAFHDHYIVPGFVDVHVHGIDGVDSLDGGSAVASIAERLPRYGVTAFCPTTVACGPAGLRAVLQQVARAREAPAAGAARVLPAHLESNFINPRYAGAQPQSCLRTPRSALTDESPAGSANGKRSGREDEDFGSAELLHEIETAAADVGIVTLAPELDGGLEMIQWLAGRGHVVSLGHSAASFDEAIAAVTAGARQATHLFNRMPPLDHRAPGLAGAILQSEEVAAELICDGVHVHPAMLRTAVAAKRPPRIMAITDGTAAAALPEGSRATLGGRTITATRNGAFLPDGTLAGSVATMDRVFRLLVETVGFSLVEAVTMCCTTPSRELGLVGHGVLAPESAADLVILDHQLHVVQTYVGGQLVYSRQGLGIRD